MVVVGGVNAPLTAKPCLSGRLCRTDDFPCGLQSHTLKRLSFKRWKVNFEAHLGADRKLELRQVRKVPEVLISRVRPTSSRFAPDASAHRMITGARSRKRIAALLSMGSSHGVGDLIVGALSIRCSAISTSSPFVETRCGRAIRTLDRAPARNVYSPRGEGLRFGEPEVILQG